MRCMVTGGAGFIGSHIADALAERDAEVLVVDDLSTGKRENIPNSAELAQVSITSPEVEQLIADFAPNVVFHPPIHIRTIRPIGGQNPAFSPNEATAVNCR